MTELLVIDGSDAGIGLSRGIRPDGGVALGARARDARTASAPTVGSGGGANAAAPHRGFASSLPDVHGRETASTGACRIVRPRGDPRAAGTTPRARRMLQLPGPRSLRGR